MKFLKFLLLSLVVSSNIFAQTLSSNEFVDQIADHYGALPVQYGLDQVKKEQLSDKITRQYLMGSQSMIVKWTLKKGAVISKHFHSNEQITWITQGSVKVVSQGKTFILKAGDVLIIPPYVPHEFFALEDTIDIDFFTPVRQDWLTTQSSATYSEPNPHLRKRINHYKLQNLQQNQQNQRG